MVNKIKKNYIYNSIYQIILILFPIVTIPHVSRMIGTDGVGIYSYTHSVTYYFVIFSMLGISNYGNRCIAKSQGNEKKISNTFISLYLLQFTLTMIMSIMFLIYINISKEYKNYFIIQYLYLISCFFDINWFYFGIENFKLSTTINTTLRIICIGLIFLFVKNKSDISNYILIMTSSTLISQIILWFPLKKYINFKSIEWQKIFKLSIKHLKPCLKLFIPVVAVSLYKYMDKIMLGRLSNINEVAFYENAEKVVSVPICFITALGTIMLPRMTNLIEKKENKKFENLIYKTMEFSMFLSFPMMFGLIAIAPDFTPIFFGTDFLKCGILIQYLAITNVFISWASVIRMQFLIPKEKDNIYIISVIIGATSNLMFNAILIPKYNALGAVIGTIVAEFLVMFIQTIMIYKEIKIIIFIKGAFKFFINSLFMFLGINFLSIILNNYQINNLLRLIVEIIFGIVLYLIFNIKYILININHRKGR